MVNEAAHVCLVLTDSLGIRGYECTVIQLRQHHEGATRGRVNPSVGA